LYHLEGKHFDTFDEVLEACGLDFTAELVELFHEYKDDDGVLIKASQPYAALVRRVDDKTPLGVNSTVYGVSQYRQWFSLPESLWQDKGLTLVYGGIQGRGTRAYLVMRAEGKIKLATDDYILNEFTVTASHDGSAKLMFMMTPRRTGNSSILTFDKPIISIKHTKNVAASIARVASILDKVSDHWEDFSDATQKMSQMTLTEDEARSFIKAVVGKSDTVRTQNIRAKVYDIFTKTGVGRVVPACNGTLFGLVQAFCEYADHHSTVRKSKYLDEAGAQLDSKTLGHAAKQKAKGWALALTLVKNKEKFTGLTKNL
jgi:phage/plasmid-like protein (TIGR03299 family)